MIDLIPFEAGHMIKLIGEGVIECGVRSVDSEIVRRLATEREAEGNAMTGLDDNTVLGCYGIDEMWPGVGEFWALFSPDIIARSIEVCRLIKSEVERMSIEYHRVQCHIRNDFYSSLRMIQWLGFNEDCICKKYTQDSADCYQYSRVK